MIRTQNPDLSWGREKTGKPASVSIAGFFFGRLEKGQKKPTGMNAVG